MSLLVTLGLKGLNQASVTEKWIINKVSLDLVVESSEAKTLLYKFTLWNSFYS